MYIPVVFFTAKGIPGEVDERLDTAEGIMAASMRSMGLRKCMACFGAALPAWGCMFPKALELLSYCVVHGAFVT